MPDAPGDREQGDLSASNRTAQGGKLPGDRQIIVLPADANLAY